MSVIISYMFDFYERRKMRNVVYSKPVLILFLGVSIFMLYSVWGVFEKEKDTRVKKNQRAAILADLEEREEVLRDEIERLNTEKGIEEEIRSKFEVAKDGEKVIVIVEPPEEVNTTDIKQKRGLIKRILDLF